MRPPPVVSRLVLILVACLTLLALATCGKDSPTKPKPPEQPPPVQKVPTRITITPASVDLSSVGETTQLAATILDQNGQPVAGAVVTWSSGDESVATVSAQGLVTAVANGIAQITARAGSASKSVTVTVSQTPGQMTVEPSMVTLMSIGETVQLAATILDQNGQPVAGAVVTWSSGDESVATVSAQGLVTAVANGIAQITARAGSASKSVTVTVSQTPGQMTVEPSMVTLMSIGETVQLAATILDQNGQPVAGAVVTWSSGDESVATVSAQGLVTAVANGIAQITARAGSASKSVTVTVSQTPGQMTVEPSMVTLMSIGETVQLAATILDQNGQPVAGAVVTWSSGDESVATVSAQGLVTAVSNGSVTITVRSGNALATAEITITDDRADRAVLTAFYNATNGSEWTRSDNWLSDGPLGEWHGVTANAAGRVTALDLAGNALSGWIPRELGGLENLQKLNLYSNALSGSIPRELGRLENLQKLYLNSNALSGSIPAALGGLKNLQDLDLDDNALSGSIPRELGGLENLQKLYLYSNALSGSIPRELGGLENLQVLALGDNALSGSIPPALGGLENLQKLYLYSNALSGSIPRELGGLENLQDLALGDNALSGSIPPALGDLEDLQGLSLGGNKLSGSIPRELGRLENLQNLVLLNNKLSGSIPRELGGLKNLQDLSLNSNALSGSIPRELGGLKNLQDLGLGDNALSGPIPHELSRLENLQWLYFVNTDLCVPGTPAFQDWLSGISWKRGVVFCDSAALIALYRATGGAMWTNDENWLSDAPPYEWFGVSAGSDGRVKTLDLVDNNLSGTLPAALGDLERLEHLNLSFNEGLFGPLPRTFADLVYLERLLLEGTRLCAPLDPYLREWLGRFPIRSITRCGEARRDYYALAALYQSTDGPNWTTRTNWLSQAPLATWYGVEANAQDEVIRLSLVDNNLQGFIPSELGQLKSLNDLRLSNNSLQGSIPSELGALENLETLALSGNSLQGSIPSELGALESLDGLYLSWNNLSGSIPSELGQLRNLGYLSLLDNRLSGSIPPELGQLRNAWNFDLRRNHFSGSIPPELGQLRNLRALGLAYNDLSGSIPSELGQLESLTNLSLDENQLTGAIPSELGALENLEELSLGNNDLQGSIPPELGALESLKTLRLDNNRFTGSIPPELGRLSVLEEMQISTNQLTGNVPDTFGDLASLRTLNLQNNSGMSGALPIEMTRLSLDELLLSGTQLCAPDDAEFQDWLHMISSKRVVLCADNIERSAAYLTQATQSMGFPVPLVAGEDALLRVFITSDPETEASMPLVRATFYFNGGEVHTVDIAGNGYPIPHEIYEGDLAASASARVPGFVLTPGLEMVVEIDPDGELDPSLGIAGRLPPVGRTTVDVRRMPSFDLTLVPFLWTENPDRSILTDVENLTAESDLFRFTRDLLPVEELELNVREPVWTSHEPIFDNMFEILAETEVIHTMDGARGHYMGVLTTGGGVANRPGLVSVSALNSFTIAHELGHNLSLRHAPCGGAFNPDAHYPYPDGSIGAWGYDLLAETLVHPDTPDLMGYCEPQWISDYHFSKAMAYRLSQTPETPMAAAFAASARSLLIWGGVNEHGEILLEPAFAVYAPASLPRLDGPYRIVGEDEAGGALFSLRFGMAEIADGEGGTFAFVIPTRADWAGRLSRIVLSGPEGIVTLGDEDDRSAALLLDPVGRVRGLLRDWPDPSPGMQAARRALPESGLEAMISRGLPASTDW